MNSQLFYLLGELPASARTVRFSESASLEDLKDLVASHFAIVVAHSKLILTLSFSLTSKLKIT
jgi:hypothetical protein